MFDVAVIGAGLAGLACARQLQRMGHNTVVLEKSRGLGGRLATRRTNGIVADHGVRYLEAQGERSQQLIQALLEQEILRFWTDQDYSWRSGQLQVKTVSPRYVAPVGLTAVAKFLAADLEIWRSRRVERLEPTPNATWQLHLIDDLAQTRSTVTAAALVVAIPAPQAVALLSPLETVGLAADYLAAVRSVDYEPCLSAIAGYAPEYQAVLDAAKLPWRSVSFFEGPLAWVGFDSSKRDSAQQPVFVVQSSAEFARQYLEVSDLAIAGQSLLDTASQQLLPRLDRPAWLQVHRWRYAFPVRLCSSADLITASPLPLVCCGDWWNGQIEGALQSGMVAAEQMNVQLQG